MATMLGFIILLSSLFISLTVYSQELPAPVGQSNQASGALDQWQAGVSAIRSQMEVLIQQNDQLTLVYNEDKVQERQLIAEIKELREKVGALNDFLKKRGRKTDQQLSMDALKDKLSIKRLNRMMTIII